MVDTVKIVISGYYGYSNCGDEAVLLSILLALQEQGDREGIRYDPVILSSNPELTAKMYGVKSVHRMKLLEIMRAIALSDGLISGGGSLLQDATSWRTIPYYLSIIKLAQWLGKPTFIYGQGVGPIHQCKFYPFIRKTLGGSQLLTVRDEESKSLLCAIGLPNNSIHVVSDPVMGLASCASKPYRLINDTREEKTYTIGVSVRFWNKDRSELDALAQTLLMLVISESVRIRFLPFHYHVDFKASEYVISRIPEQYHTSIVVVKEFTDPLEMLKQVSECDVIIGMRLHSLIYAATQHIPMVGISYDPKIDQFLDRLHMKPSSSTATFDVNLVYEDIVQLMNHREKWVDAKQDVINELKQTAQLPSKMISSYYRDLYDKMALKG